ncbi:hypothetical protein M2283_009160 [Streptomyces pseudovenezuelae]|uniref:Uncharacterized protein n=1 Tax=Streptomyces pseudovenezuelae TaxID=67350 RepID=A0ABT6LZS4_9ACTN|nr:hypothetical protein [Streptomyces pseudovenezuelae]
MTRATNHGPRGLPSIPPPTTRYRRSYRPALRAVARPTPHERRRHPHGRSLHHALVRQATSRKGGSVSPVRRSTSRPSRPAVPANGHCGCTRTRAPGQDTSRFNPSRTGDIPDPLEHRTDPVHHGVAPPGMRRPVRRHQSRSGLHGTGIRITEGSLRVLSRLRTVHHDLLDRLEHDRTIHARLHRQPHLETRQPPLAVPLPRRIRRLVLVRHALSPVISSRPSRNGTPRHRHELRKPGESQATA